MVHPSYRNSPIPDSGVARSFKLFAVGWLLRWSKKCWNCRMWQPPLP